MSRTNKQIIFTSELEEKRNSHKKNIRAFIRNNHLSGLLNNHTWQEIFDWICSERMAFEYKTLLSNDEFMCNFILENEGNSVLLTTDGYFIDFFEFEYVKIRKDLLKNEMPQQLLKLSTDFGDYFLIEGYRK